MTTSQERGAELTGRAHIHLLERELLFDISSYAWIEGEVTPTQTPEQKSLVIDIAQDGNIYIVHRMLALAHAEVSHMLLPYVSDPIEHGELATDELVTEHNYCFWMRLPEDFTDTVLNLLQHLIHRYMVARVLAEWLSLMQYPRMAYWHDLLDSLRDQIKGCINTRTGRVRRKLNPF